MKLKLRREFLILKEGKFYVKKVVKSTTLFLDVTDKIKKSLKLL